MQMNALAANAGDAEAQYLKTLEAAPGDRQALLDLARVKRASGQRAAAVSMLHETLQIYPSDSQITAELADAVSDLFKHALECHRLGRLDDAETGYRGVLDVDAEFLDARHCLGVLLSQRGDLEQAERLIREALDLKPDQVEAWTNLGNVLDRLRPSGDEALVCYEEALRLQPDYVEALYNYGTVLIRLGRWRDAAARLERAIALDPAHARAHNNLGFALQELGRLDEALVEYREAVRLQPDYSEARCNLIFLLPYLASTEASDILAACREWDTHLGSGVLPAPAPHGNSREPERRLRIGYLSPDFRSHAAAYFLEPLFIHHDRAKFDVCAYSEASYDDDVSYRLRSLAERWVDTRAMSDDALERRLRADGVDILVDCAGHAKGHRLPVFARKPAPVQISTFLGDPFSLGLSTMDRIFGDAVLTPPDNDSHFTEKVVRLPRLFAPFSPRVDWPAVFPLPQGKVVLGCFAEPNRFNDATVRLWRRILDATPGARMLLRHSAYANDEKHDRARKVLAPLGDRFDIEAVTDYWADMSFYGRVSMTLDPFPVTGGTSTLIPLWMGVPVVTMAGRHTAQRFGAAFLSGAGLGELVADAPDAYVAIAVALANDRPRLETFRRELRGRLQQSPLGDPRSVTRDVEAAYRDAWRDWCTGARP